MEWIQVLTIIGVFTGFFLWGRSEASADRRASDAKFEEFNARFDARFDASNARFDAMHQELMNYNARFDAVHRELMGFHGRLTEQELKEG